MLVIKCGLIQLADLRLHGSCWKDPVPTERPSLFQAVVQLGCQSNLRGPDYKHCEVLSWCKAALLIRSCSKYFESSTLLWDWATTPGCAHSQGLVPGAFWLVCLLGLMPSGRDLMCPGCRTAGGPPGNGSGKAAVVVILAHLFGQWTAISWPCADRKQGRTSHQVPQRCWENQNTSWWLLWCPFVSVPCSQHGMKIHQVGDATLPHLWLSGGELCCLSVFQPQNSLATEQRQSAIASFQVLAGASLWIWCFSVQDLGTDFHYCCLAFPLLPLLLILCSTTVCYCLLLPLQFWTLSEVNTFASYEYLE